MKLELSELKDFLEEKYYQYNTSQFIETDPVQIPHLFIKKQDIEISGLLAATIAWGNRTSIIKNSKRLIDIMGGSPYEYIMNFNPDKVKISSYNDFKHRTFNSIDLHFFFSALHNIYSKHESLENVFVGETTYDKLNSFRNNMLDIPHENRSEKHISSALKGSACKRLNMFLRWMVRKDNIGTDLGVWNNFKSSELYLPLDVHTARVSRSLGLLERKQNDWKAVDELTANLRKFDSEDPVKYDYALFGLGVFEKF